MEVKAEHSASYVIVVPKVETDSERWACAANNAKLITSSSDSSSSNGSGKKDDAYYR